MNERDYLDRGGPMLFADTAGLYNVMGAIHRYNKGYHGEAWEPAALLEQLAEQGKRFNG